MKLSQRALGIHPSPTLAIDAKAKQMIQEGMDVIGFGAGEPDFDTPEGITQEAINSLRRGETKYTPASGTLQLKEAVCYKMERDHGLKYNPNEVVICCGAKHALYNLFQVICDPGDEVIIPAPYWVSYSEQVVLAGAKPVFIQTTEAAGFRMTAAQFEAAITPRTVALVLNSPSNPTGAVYSKAELEAIAKVAVTHKILVISDEIYEQLIYENTHHSIAALNPEIKAQTIIINGVAKTFAMTGWRIGYAVGDAKIIKAIGDLQSHSTSNPVTFCQSPSALALRQPPVNEINQMVQEFKKRRDYMVNVINQIPGISCRKPEGAFYVFANISGLIGKDLAGKIINNGDDFAEVLLEKANVAVVPGTGFGAPGYIRLSYATSMEKIEKGLERIKRFVESELK
ncbi:MAG TPA: pyridoxal phosphate-dependent aminotransferase [Bacillota bacterium]|jgi:aspartate aminotransferase|nr:pyridoxal phosphate-dependent aminotransferase [Bacillota bacterium]HOL08590.1 pyridoxal phosphate-dependent aminotransferase [Bacillota bacterium]HPO98614.1 pyridoxal phosphate-dependent aminotransferase [Bacillota bacterium]